MKQPLVLHVEDGKDLTDVLAEVAEAFGLSYVPFNTYSSFDRFTKGPEIWTPEERQLWTFPYQQREQAVLGIDWVLEMAPGVSGPYTGLDTIRSAAISGMDLGKSFILTGTVDQVPRVIQRAYGRGPEGIDRLLQKPLRLADFVKTVKHLAKRPSEHASPRDYAASF